MTMVAISIKKLRKRIRNLSRPSVHKEDFPLIGAAILMYATLCSQISRKYLAPKKKLHKKMKHKRKHSVGFDCHVQTWPSLYLLMEKERPK
jgi:hypothetical protein